MRWKKGIHRINISKFYNSFNCVWKMVLCKLFSFSFFFPKHVPRVTLEIAVVSGVNVRLLRPVTTWLVIVFHPRVKLDSRDPRVNIVRTLYRSNAKLCLQWNNFVNIWIFSQSMSFIRKKSLTLTLVYDLFSVSKI